MKHLLKVLGGTKVKEKLKTGPKQYFNNNCKYSCGIINGFMFRLNQNQWAKLFGISQSTFTYKFNRGDSIADMIIQYPTGEITCLKN